MSEIEDLAARIARLEEIIASLSAYSGAADQVLGASLSTIAYKVQYPNSRLSLPAFNPPSGLLPEHLAAFRQIFR
ncbi:hypothetical protein D2T29_05360 [Sinirhodobacter populi]|uniref:Uncharacterized protein n=1 Tax=Paenirhodobacter populi TaxID=2306993 RepID=A0A443J112_9RHOB|nr:hypothetical protein [Sinirhodobacter populi]RWR14301.1 hypothetical protein D2T33_03555 [Sinirhodobacter populi]RWR33698.1 hypothetical protein D2T29_05360 [Sinirhodobacter populi]